ncbi:MAG TPA: ATPase domain-containing protein [Candidatus Bathyarchaeia archaeon]|nr:ATPase domain-containing protein [Candidatus Bathyarchaeia archaeon]
MFASLSESERVKTGIQGLNELTEGGLPRGFSLLLLGGPGTGKTTFGVQ